MRRIKLVVSDFHLGSGRILKDGVVNDLEDFVSDQAFIDLMEFYRTGEHVDAEVELILNGDIFEGLAVVPEKDGADMITAKKSLEKIEAIIQGHHRLFQALRAFADSEKRKVTIIVGNHDQDLLWEEVQKKLYELIHPQIRIINQYYQFDGVHIEHGNQHELHNQVNPSKMFLTKNLEEPILNLPWGSDLFINCIMRIKRTRPYINRVRPFRLLLSWSLFHDFRALMHAVWYFMLAIFKARFRRHKQRRITFLKLIKMVIKADAWPTLENAARKVLQEEGLHTVIFGHTHIPISRQPFPGKSYINSGSWLPTTGLHISGLGTNLMQIFVYIEYEGQMPRARLKLWHGRRVVEEDIVL